MQLPDRERDQSNDDRSTRRLKSSSAKSAQPRGSAHSRHYHAAPARLVLGLARRLVRVLLAHGLVLVRVLLLVLTLVHHRLIALYGHVGMPLRVGRGRLIGH